jgi:hypothetical protein
MGCAKSVSTANHADHAKMKTRIPSAHLAQFAVCAATPSALILFSHRLSRNDAVGCAWLPRLVAEGRRRRPRRQMFFAAAILVNRE